METLGYTIYRVAYGSEANSFAPLRDAFNYAVEDGGQEHDAFEHWFQRADSCFRRGFTQSHAPGALRGYSITRELLVCDTRELSPYENI